VVVGAAPAPTFVVRVVDDEEVVVVDAVGHAARIRRRRATSAWSADRPHATLTAIHFAT
jgi:hypothetical protein